VLTNLHPKMCLLDGHFERCSFQILLLSTVVNHLWAFRHREKHAMHFVDRANAHGGIPTPNHLVYQCCVVRTDRDENTAAKPEHRKATLLCVSLQAELDYPIRDVTLSVQEDSSSESSVSTLRAWYAALGSHPVSPNPKQYRNLKYKEKL
jgi:hypothetical protein